MFIWEIFTALTVFDYIIIKYICGDQHEDVFDYIRIFLQVYTKHVYTACLQWIKFCNINDKFKRVIGIPVNWQIPTDIWTKISSYPRQNICWNMSIYWDIDSLKLQNLSQLKNR